jgi:predicted nucleic-acid-binding Zn-ribbon protein
MTSRSLSPINAVPQLVSEIVMKMTEEQLSDFEAWLEVKKVNMTCVKCGNTQTEVGDDLLMLTEPSAEGLKVLPFAYVGCTNCSHIDFYGAKLIGLMP